MKSPLVELLTRKTLLAAQLLLATLVVLAVWIFNQFNVADAVSSAESVVFIEVSRFEFLLVLVLLFLNVAAAYTIFRQFNQLNRLIKYTMGLMILSLLLMSVWLGRLFLLEAIQSALSDQLTTGVSLFEVLLVLILIFANVLAGFLLFRRYRQVEPYVVISAYSKKVQYKGAWITIEEYLLRELGIQVSHGITPEEKQKALADFERDLANGKADEPMDDLSDAERQALQGG